MLSLLHSLHTTHSLVVIFNRSVSTFIRFMAYLKYVGIKLVRIQKFSYKFNQNA